MTLPDTFKRILDTYRHINYWIKDAEWPEVEGGEQFFTEALEVSNNILCYFYINFTLNPLYLCSFFP
jgi:hypothetical protein